MTDTDIIQKKDDEIEHLETCVRTLNEKCLAEDDALAKVLDLYAAALVDKCRFERKADDLQGNDEYFKEKIEKLEKAVKNKDALIAEAQKAIEDGRFEKTIAELSGIISDRNAEIEELRKSKNCETAWTTETPSEEGVYWILAEDNEPKLLRIYTSVMDGRCVCYVGGQAFAYHHFIDKNQNAKWCRITPPEITTK